jgi:hypothetical protein
MAVLLQDRRCTGCKSPSPRTAVLRHERLSCSGQSAALRILENEQVDVRARKSQNVPVAVYVVMGPLLHAGLGEPLDVALDLR